MTVVTILAREFMGLRDTESARSHVWCAGRVFKLVQGLTLTIAAAPQGNRDSWHEKYANPIIREHRSFTFERFDRVSPSLMAFACNSCKEWMFGCRAAARHT